MTAPLESEEQEVLAMQLDAWGVMWFHCPNGEGLLGGRRDGSKFGKLRKMRRLGMKPGVVDAIVFTTPPKLGPSGEVYRGAAGELKRQRGPRGGTSASSMESWPRERAFLADLHDLGWLVPTELNEDTGLYDPVPWYGAAEAIEWLRDVGGYR